MLGREIPDLSQVDHSAAVEMLAPKRHQNPRQVEMNNPLDRFHWGWDYNRVQGCSSRSLLVEAICRTGQGCIPIIQINTAILHISIF